ncbi:MAG: glycosyltransferase 87 family protein [Thermoleophilaceae bacterium]
MSRRATIWALGAIAAVSALLSYRTNSDWDYPEDAGPAIDALIHGRVHDFLAARPLMGPVSLIIRAPFAALSYLTGTGAFYNNQYRLGVFPCMVAAGLLGLWLAKLVRERGQPQLVQFAVVALCMVNPVTLRAIEVGHPEEILGAVFCAAAVACGVRGRPWLGSAFLALAIGTKQWAVLAIVPFALTLQPRELRRAATVAVGLTALLLAPLLLVDAGSLWTMTRNLSDVRGTGVLPGSIWWRFTVGVTGSGTVPGWLGVIAHPLIVGGGVALALAFARRARSDPLRRALPLLALVLLVRCMLDPLDNAYYHVPFFIALVAADALDGSFAASLIATAALWLTSKIGAHGSAALNAFYLFWSIPFAAYLGGRAYGAGWAGLRLRSRGARGPDAEPSPPPSAAGARTPAAR